jgi:DNA-binding MarR family transcriptional regulator
MSTHLRNRLADKVWHDLTRLVMDNKDTWRRAVVTETGLPFSRVRILMRLADRSLTVKEVAAAATIDAPAATVAVNDLEDRGLVVREINPENRRCKLVSLTPAGHDLVAVVRAIDDPAPPAVADLNDDDLTTLQQILAKCGAGRYRH